MTAIVLSILICFFSPVLALITLLAARAAEKIAEDGDHD